MQVSTPSGSPAERSRPGGTIAATRPAPASRAATIGHATIGRPQTGWSIFGVEERIRVPSPAAITSTRGELTLRSYCAGGVMCPPPKTVAQLIAAVVRSVGPGAFGGGHMTLHQAVSPASRVLCLGEPLR